VIGLEPKGSAAGPTLGLWDVKLETDDGVKNCSFNSSIPKSSDDPQGEQIIYPGFLIIQAALKSHVHVRITGYVTEEEVDGQNQESHRGTSVEPLEEIPDASLKSSGITVGFEDAKWALGVAMSAMPRSTDGADLDAVRKLASSLLDTALELAGGVGTGTADISSIREKTDPD
jgi:hypothetical protein